MPTDLETAVAAHLAKDADDKAAVEAAHAQDVSEYEADLNAANSRAEAAEARATVAEAEVVRLRGLLPKTTRYGMNLSPGSAWTKAAKETSSVQAARLKDTYGPLPVIKWFYSGALPARFMPANEGQAPVAYVCCKYNQVELAARKHDAQINAYLDTVPDGQQVRIVNWQEPDDEMWVRGDFTAAQHRAATDHLCDLVHNHAAGKDGRAEVWECYMGYSLDVKRFDDNAVSRKVDGIGYDYYWNSQKAGAQDPAVALKAQADKTKALGIKRYSLLETGDNPDTFTDGKARATFWGRVWDVTAALGYEHSVYFNAYGTTGDHRLIPGDPYSDPTIAAYKARIAG